MQFSKQIVEIHPPKGKIVQYKDKSIFILEDFQGPGTLGTKLRKAKGLLEELKTSQYKKVSMFGSRNSNFLAAFSLFFKLNGFSISTFTYSHSSYRGGNSILTEHFSDSIDHFSSKNDLLVSPEYQKHKNSPDCFSINEFGIHKGSLNGLRSLWNHPVFEKFKTIVLDVGSGLTYLSALEFFGSRKKIIGISLGLGIPKMNAYLKEQELNLSLNVNREYELISPAIAKSYNSKSKTLSQFIGEMGEKEVFLEPMYSGKSLYTIFHSFHKSEMNEVLYLHQGGLISVVGDL